MTTPTRDLATRLVELACRAPSVHNTQPWRWRLVDDATIELYADRGRQLPVSDPDGRNLALSCGAALHHAVVAARGLELTPVVQLQPSESDPDLLARIRLEPGGASAEAAEQLKALEARATDRRRFTSWAVPEVRLAHLAESAAGWGARAFPITDAGHRHRAEELIGEAMAAQASDPRFAEEQRAWTAHPDLDGVPASNATPLAPDEHPTRPNRFDPAGGSPAEADPVLDSSDGLVAVCTGGDDQRSWVQAGEALSALWLRATHDGLAVVPLSQVVEVEETRKALHEDVFDGMARPQVLARVAWLESSRPPLARTPRRPVSDVIEG